MNLIPVLTAVLAIGASLVAIEGVNLASGGEFYLASIAQLVQESSGTTAPPPTEPALIRPPEPAPVPPPPADAQPLPPPPDNTREPLPPPPERPVIPLEPINPAPPQPVQPPRQMPDRPSDQSLPPPNQPQDQPPPPPDREQRREFNAFPDEGEGEEQEPQEFVDPREIQQALKDIKQMRNDIKRNYLRQLKKIASEADVSKLNEILADLDKFQNIIGNRNADVSDIRDAIQEFRDAQYWEILNAMRARLQIPQEIKQITQSLKRLERTAKTKAVQNLGFNMERVGQAIAGMKQNIEAVQNHYNNGEFEEAQEAMQEFHQGFNPGDLESTIFRVRDIKNMLKRVKDTGIRAEVEKVLQEVIDTFNNGEYRDARETLDEYADDLQNLINKYLVTTGWGWGKKKINREESFSRIRSLEGLIKAKLEKEGASLPGETNSAKQQPRQPSQTPANR